MLAFQGGNTTNVFIVFDHVYTTRKQKKKEVRSCRSRKRTGMERVVILKWCCSSGIYCCLGDVPFQFYTWKFHELLICLCAYLHPESLRNLMQSLFHLCYRSCCHVSGDIRTFTRSLFSNLRSRQHPESRTSPVITSWPNTQHGPGSVSRPLSGAMSISTQLTVVFWWIKLLLFCNGITSGLYPLWWVWIDIFCLPQ